MRVIAIDFDGCLCENAWPDIGQANHAVIAKAKQEQDNGAKLILWTCREGEMLDKAVNWCAGHGLEFDAHNENVKELLDLYGNDCRKVGADEYWDDKAITIKYGEVEDGHY